MVYYPIPMHPIPIIKFETASITDSPGNLAEEIITGVASQVALLIQKCRVVLVLSGAAGVVKNWVANYKAAAATGNPVLISNGSKYFQPFGIEVTQSPCERGHFANRSQFLQLKETFETLWKSGAIPIESEND
jgi:glutamate 5-kinase